MATSKTLGNSGVTIPLYVLNQFVALFHGAMCQRDSMQNPEKTLRGYMGKASVFFGNHSYFDPFLFQIEEGELVSVVMLPRLTAHAKVRMAERFGIKSRGEQLLCLASDFAGGRMLTNKERMKNRIGKGLKALACNDRIYLLNPTLSEVITIVKKQ